MKKKEQLSGFLIRRLIVILFFIAVSQSIISVLFTTVFYPFINTHFHIDLLAIVNASNSSLVAIVKSLIWFLGSALISITPEVSRMPLRRLLGEFVSQGWENYFAHISAEDQWKMTVFFVLILLFACIVYLTPYVIATLVYSKWIIQKVEELRKQDALDREAFAQQRNLLLSDIAHDLKTPITTISGYANALKDHMVEEDDKKEQYLATISAKSIQMSQLINLLFQYVTLDSEGFALNCKKTDLVELVTKTVAVNYSDIENAGFELEMKVPEIQIIASVDEVQMSRVVTNLIQNAIRHNPKDTRLMIVVNNLYDRVTIDIVDSGVVIDESIREHLFDPFVMGDDSRTHRGGSGLGLSISAKIVELHGGKITLQQPYDKGGEEQYTKAFHVELPV